ncbi:MAG: efflux RND transporter periplasmic adaptor subunit, partial [Anaerolineales bacterium]
SIESDILDAQYDQAVSALEAAQVSLKSARSGLASSEASLKVAQANLELAQVKYDIELTIARMQELPLREDAWNERTLSEFDLPDWYFNKPEEIAAAEVEVDAAWDSLQIEKENLDDVLESISNADLSEAETKLAQAQAAFLVADKLKSRRVGQTGSQEIRDYIQDLYDTADANLTSAQKNYDSLLSDLDEDDLIEARARIEVAQERYEIALDQLHELYTGEESLQVQAAEIGVKQAEAMLTQAEAAKASALSGVQFAEKSIAQAEATVDLIEIQLDQLTVVAPTSGVVLIRNIESGELVQPGINIMTIGQLDKLSITVYVPEDKYGEIKLGDSAFVSVDSFPDEVFEAVVTRIADQAEYTPRNVQTEEDRKTTVFAVELSVDDPDGNLKPGMPADVSFGE